MGLPSLSLLLRLLLLLVWCSLMGRVEMLQALVGMMMPVRLTPCSQSPQHTSSRSSSSQSYSQRNCSALRRCPLLCLSLQQLLSCRSSPLPFSTLSRHHSCAHWQSMKMSRDLTHFMPPVCLVAPLALA